jgi:hypothetical protein
MVLIGGRNVGHREKRESFSFVRAVLLSGIESGHSNVTFEAPVNCCSIFYSEKNKGKGLFGVDGSKILRWILRK